jgi:hypothetical protein
VALQHPIVVVSSAKYVPFIIHKSSLDGTYFLIMVQEDDSAIL